MLYGIISGHEYQDVGLTGTIVGAAYHVETEVGKMESKMMALKL